MWRIILEYFKLWRHKNEEKGFGFFLIVMGNDLKVHLAIHDEL